MPLQLQRASVGFTGVGLRRRSSRRILSPVEVGHVMRTLALDGGQVLGRDQSAPQEQLFVLPIQDDQSHDEVLVFAKQLADLTMG